MKKRQLDICVISDVHLGTYGCHAKELFQYLNSIQPKVLILNGDIVDAWQFNKKYFPKEHISVIRKLLKFAKSGTTIHYLVGNHDEFLRKYIPLELDNFHLDNKVVLDVDGQKLWFFHGDVFDLSVQYSKWLAKIGGKSYDWLIRINRLVNQILQKFNRPKMSLSKRVKEGVKTAAKFISNFEEIAAKKAIEHNYDYVVCGHIHQPQIKTFRHSSDSVVYMNSGDWVENLTSLEYSNQQWKLYQHEDHKYEKSMDPEEMESLELELSEIESTQIDLEAFMSPNISKYVF